MVIKHLQFEGEKGKGNMAVRNYKAFLGIPDLQQQAESPQMPPPKHVRDSFHNSFCPSAEIPQGHHGTQLRDNTPEVGDFLNRSVGGSSAIV
eukprot:1145975-Pelagomonas_calceolata.AAC.1